MHISAVIEWDTRKAAEALILPFWEDDKESLPAFSSKEFASLYMPALESGDFQGKEGEILFLYRAHKKESRVLLLGLGKKKSSSLESMRRAYGALIKRCRQKKLKSLNIGLPETDFVAASAMMEGMLLSNYAFDSLRHASLKTVSFPLIQKICLLGADESLLADCKRAQKIVDCVHFACDLVNGNADDVSPQRLALEAKGLQKEFASIKTTILDKKQIEKEKMGLILAVNRSSDRDPTLVIVEYKGDPDSKDLTALVGKGITFDTGGLNIKTSGMETMKCDMSGAAAVLATVRAAALLKLKVNLLAVAPCTENAIGPKSYKPGDVYVSYSGRTVEITNTDAEGRLVLADALSYVQEKYHPSRLIDLATLTGGIVVALGEEVSGLFCTDDKLAEDLRLAGEKTYERVWRMPLFSEYRDLLKSHVADIKNSGERKASPIQGAIFLLDFIKNVPWAHLDIAGTAFLSAPKGYHATQATGVGVRLLIEYLMQKSHAV